MGSDSGLGGQFTVGHQSGDLCPDASGAASPGAHAAPGATLELGTPAGVRGHVRSGLWPGAGIFFQILGVMILLSMWAGVLRPTWGWTALVLLVALIFGPALIAIVMFATAGLFVLIRHVERAKPGAGEGKPDGGKDPDG